MLSELTLRRELGRVKAKLDTEPDGRDHEALYGAMQALSWALGQNAACPSTFGGGKNMTGSETADG